METLNRTTLSAQAAAAIRTGIEEGRWNDHLPGERRLCEFFQVSRPTIRIALQTLAREGLVDIRHGRRNRLIKKSPRAARAKNRLVGLVTPLPASHMSQTSHQMFTELRAQLIEHGFATETLVCPSVGTRMRLRAVEDFVRQNRVFCSVLISASREVQQWFALRSFPGLVLGSCHQGVNLPSVDVDYRSVCRHAAGIFLGQGHRKIALVIEDSGFAGDLASEQGFREGVDQHRGSDRALAIVIRHDGSARNVTAQLDALFKSGQGPTAILAAPQPWAAFAVMLYLLRRGLAVPDTVSLIARDQDHLFESVDPQISHYRFEENAFAHRVSRLVLKLVGEGHLKPEPTMMIPKFFPGGTVKRRAKITP